MTLTSGTEAFDELVHGVRVGDNLVLLGSEAAVLEPLVRAFVDTAGRDRPLVVVAVSDAWPTPAPRDARILDWRTIGDEAAEPPTADGLPADATIVEACAQLEAVDREVGGEAAFLFDSLTAIQRAWGPEAALELFLWACPRLYRRGSIALWPVERGEHDAAFLARLQEITQVVVDVRPGAEGDLEAEVLKADGRPSGTVGRKARLRLQDGRLTRSGPITTSHERFGTLIRLQRSTRQLSQAELARRVGISPSALSQVERGVRGLSADTLVRIWEVLGVPFGPEPPLAPGYQIARRGAHEPTALASGVMGQQLFDVPDTGTGWRLTVAPDASGSGPLLSTKAPEVVLLLAGVLDLELAGRRETLQDGDVAVIHDAVVTGWANPGRLPAEALWLLLRR